MSAENKKYIQVFVVDDEQGMCDLLRMELELEGYRATAFTNPLEALRQLEKQKVDLVISDMKMPEIDGLQLLAKIKKIDPSIEVIMTTAYGTVETAVCAMKEGAYDFVLKPFNVQEMTALVEKCIEKRQLKALLALYESSKAIFSTIKMEELYDIVMKLLPTVLGADEGSLMLVGPDKALKMVASLGFTESIERTIHLKIGERVAGKIAQSGKPALLINGLEKYPEFKDIPSNPKIKSSMVCPLFYQGELLGILNVNRTQKNEDFTLADLHSASIFASQVAVAIQNAKLYQYLEEAFVKLKATQDQLLQSEKLATMGRFVAGIAHELNNPLTSVIGYSQLALDSPLEVADIRNNLSIVIDQAQRCSTIVRELLLFARPRKPDFQKVNIGRMIEETVKGLQLEFEKRKVEVVLHPSSEEALIPGDPHLLKLVLSNILTNAYQALEEKMGARKLEISVRSQADKLKIGFKDNGPGIRQENLPKIFDPFFSTKGVGKGTGLGLSLCYGIMKEHQGSISALGAPEGGTIFTLEFPLSLPSLVKQEAKRESPVEKAPPSEDRKTKRILIVEDEEPIRKLITTLLSPENFELEEASDGDAALEKLCAQEYDLVLCDYQISKLDGLKLYQKIRKMNPRLSERFIFVSGSSQILEKCGTLFKDQKLKYLLKPFTKTELLSAVHSIIYPDILKTEGQQ